MAGGQSKVKSKFTLIPVMNIVMSGNDEAAIPFTEVGLKLMAKVVGGGKQKVSAELTAKAALVSVCG